MKKITASILTTLLMLSMVFSSSVFAANEETSAWDSFLGLFSAKASADDVGVEYRGHIQNVGDYPTDGSWIQGPERLGTVGKSLRLEAFWIKLTDAPEGLHIKYEVHVQNIGWMAPVEDGKLAGTQGDSLRIEAIKISLVDDEGNVSGDYTVTYKGHIQNVGDTAWIKSGQQLGTTGSGLRLEALEVKIEKIAPDLTDYEAALAAVTEANYTKASWAAYQDVVEDNVMTEDNVQSEVDAATAIILDAQEDLVTVPVIAGMTATAQKTITITGTELSKLSAGMLTVANNTVASVVASADGTSAVVTLGTDLVPETNTKVTATVDGTAKEYTVKYTVAAVKVALQSETFDDDKKGQALTVLVDGVATTYDYLTKAGYGVTYTVWNSSSVNVTSAFLTTSGGVNVPATVGDYTAQVTLKKDSAIVSSEITSIKVRNLDNNATDISAYELTNNTTGVTQASTTLISGEQAFFNKVVVGYGDAAAEILATAAGSDKFSVTSSNAAVVSANSNTDMLTAVGLGTADITITVGKATKVVTVTVAGEARKVTTVTPKSSTMTAVAPVSSSPTTAKMTVVLKDQYGDPFKGTVAGSGIAISTPVITGLTLASSTSNPITSVASTKGEVDINFDVTDQLDTGKTGLVVFRNKDNAVVGSFNVVTSGENTVAKKEIAIDTTAIDSNSIGASSDLTLNADLASDTRVAFKVNQFNKDGVSLGAVTALAGYVVEFNKDIVAIKEYTGSLPLDSAITANSSGTVTLGTSDRIAVKGLKAGSTTLVVREVTTQKIVGNVTITVTKGAPYMASVAFKTPATFTSIGAVNYEQVLAVDKTSGDPIVTNISLATASVFKIRMTTTATSNVNTLYLDVDSNGSYTSADTKLGELSAKWLADNTSTAVDVTNPYVGYTTANGSKGIVTFTVYDTVNAKAVGTQGVTVNVPLSDAQVAANALIASAQTTLGTSHQFTSYVTLSADNSSALKTQLDAKLAAATPAITGITLTVTKTNDTTYAVQIADTAGKGTPVTVAMSVTSPVTFDTLVQTGGTTATVTSTGLTITLNQDIDLVGANVTLTGATAGTLVDNNDKTYSLPISAITVANGENVTVAIAKTGYVITPASKTAAVYKDTTAPTVTSKLAASGTTTTTSLVFSEAINTTSRDAVKTIVDASYAVTGDATVVSTWAGDNKTLNVVVTPGTGTVTHGAVSVPASFTVTDLAGNASAVLNAAALQN